MSWKQVTAPIMSTVDLPGMCARFQWKAFGARNGWGFGSATAAWNGQAKKHPGEWPPTGVAVPIWLSWTKDPNGHAAISLADGRVLTSPVRGTTVGQEIYPSIQAMMNAFGGGMTYLGWGEQMDGTVVVEWVNIPVGPTQRQVGPNQVIRRAAPSTTAQIIEPSLEPGVVGNFNGWIRGESVAGNNVWFRGINGHYFWSGGFTSQATTGLADLNPVAPPAPVGNQRTVGGVPAVRRTEPSSKSAAKEPQLAAGTVGNFDGWVRGESVAGNNVWFRGTSGDWFWSGAFTSQSTAGLTDLNGAAPAPAPAPDEPDYIPFTAFHPVVTKAEPAHTYNYMRGNFPTAQTDVVLHDFGTDGRDTFTGTVSWFKNRASETSAHFVVSGDNIVQMVPLNDRAYHAGPKGNGFVGVEIDPAVGRAVGDPLRDKTVASVRRLLDALNTHYGRELTLRKHPEFMATSCGDDVDLAVFTAPEPAPEPEPELDDGELKQSITGLTALIQKLIDLLKSIFKVGA